MTAAANQLGQDELYLQAASEYGPALERLAGAYELNADKRRDLLQDVHVGLWRSFADYDRRCSLRTWVYRVAHNIATSHVMRERRMRAETLYAIEELENIPDSRQGERAAEQEALARLHTLIERLKPLDRQVILSYLEGMDAAAIGEITGLSPGNIATKVHRIKSILARDFERGVA